MEKRRLLCFFSTCARVWAEANKLRMRWRKSISFHFSFFSYKIFFSETKPSDDAPLTNSVRALFAVQNTLQNHRKRVDVLKPGAPFGRRKKLPAAGSAAKVSTNRSNEK